MRIRTVLPLSLHASRLEADSVFIALPSPWKGEKTFTIITEKPNEQISIFLFFLAQGSETFSLRLVTEQWASGTNVRVFARSVLGGSSRFSFSARCYVAPHAEMSEVFFSHHALILSPDASVQTIPALEICTDSVKASHAASVGSFDEEAVNYLAMRGFSENEAHRVLAEGFLFKDAAHFPRHYIPAGLEKRLKQISHSL